MTDELTVWTVDNYCDRIRERTRTNAERGQKFLMSQDNRYEIFPTKREALAYCITRAEKDVADAKDTLKAAERCLSKLKARAQAEG